MPGARHKAYLASICVAAMMSACATSAASAQALDTSRLPRAPGAKEIYASPPTTIYTAPEPVAQAAAAAGKALAADGWRQYAIPNAATASDSNTQLLFFKKGPQALSMLVTLAPGQTRTANVNYGVKPVANDLPVPPDAADLAFDPERPYLSCATAGPVAATLDFFRKELAASGWSPAVVGAQTTDNSARAFFTRANQPPLLLTLLRGDDGKTKVELQGVSAADLAAEAQKAKPAPQPAPAMAAKSAPKPQEPRSEVEDLTDAMLKQAQQATDAATADAISGLKAPAPSGKQAQAAAPAPAGSVESLGALAGSAAPIPLPETAEDVDFDGAKGELEFNSASSVKAVAAFFRGAMKPLGWKESPSVINRPNMVELDFSKAGKDLSLTIMQTGPNVNVTGRGEGLVDSAAKPDAEAGANAPAVEAALEAEETGGLPVPKNHTMSGTEQTPFRHGLTADVPVDLAAVLAFYRRELTKRDWKEQSAGTVVKPDEAVVVFSSPDGPAVLKLVHKNDDTSVSLTVKDPDKAAKAGMQPKPGQAKIMFGNTLGAEAVITINKQTIKIAAGAGSKAADGPKLDLPPGKYKIAVKMAGQPVKTEEVEIAAGEAWGVLIGPGGLLPLQVY